MWPVLLRRVADAGQDRSGAGRYDWCRDPGARSMPATPKNRRAHERYCLPPMYTTVSARRGDATVLHGHVYDISEGGARIELDEALAPGENVTVDLALPGGPAGFRVRGRVVWVNDEADDPGPRRMALRFDGFGGGDDRERLARYLAGAPHRHAA